jgi:glycosyltransferase involved in cell wall biosynthesis
MESLPLVSIALCTYNGEKFLVQQLDTLVNQTYKNLEIIAVDDGSTDGTLDILNAYAKKYPNFIVYQNEQNKGFLKNFETASTYCNGEFIAYSDQDDLWHPQKIELMVNAIGDNMLLYHDSELIDDNNEPIGKKMSDLFNFYRGDQPEIFLFYNCVSGHAMLIRKSLLEYAFPLRENYFHDWWMAYVATNIGTIDFIGDALVQYRQHSTSNTDVMGLNEEAKKKREDPSKAAKLAFESGWLKHCLDFKHNKHPDFIKKLYKFYIDRFSSFTAFRYWLFLKKHMDILFYLNTHTDAWKTREIGKYKWGLAGKNFWYTYIRSAPEKILRYKN